jgi:hypothetical protein
MRIRRLGAAVLALGLVVGTSRSSFAQSNIDFLVSELTQRATQFAAGFSLFGPVQTGRLRTNAKKNFNFVLTAGQCYKIIGVGDTNVRDLDIFLRVRNQNVAQDTATDNFPVVSYCPTTTTRVQVRVLMFAGQGEFALGVFNGPPDGLGIPLPQANGAQMVQRLASVAAQNAAGFVGLGAPITGQLAQAGTTTINVPLRQGACYKFIAVGGPGVTDLDIQVNANGRQVAQDTATDDFPIASYCAPIPQTVQVQILMYRGNGGFAYQTFQSGGLQPPPPVVGGNDFLSNRMREISGRFASGRLPVSPLMRGSLQTSQTRDFSVGLQTGHCYTVVGVADPSVTDLDLFLFDQNGTQVAQDQATDNFPIVQACPSVPGNYRIQVKMYSGYGSFALQVFGN